MIRAAILALLLPLSAVAADKESEAVGAFLSMSTTAYSMCQMTSKLELDGARLNAELANLRNNPAPAPPALPCIDNTLANVEPAYQKANAATAKNKARNAMVKDYYAAWRTAVGAIRPDPGEIVIGYNRRQAAAATAIKEKAERLNLE